jgi:hypothetical protein
VPRNPRATTMHCGSMKHAHSNGFVLLHGNYHPLRFIINSGTDFRPACQLLFSASCCALHCTVYGCLRSALLGRLRSMQGVHAASLVYCIISLTLTDQMILLWMTILRLLGATPWYSSEHIARSKITEHFKHIFSSYPFQAQSSIICWPRNVLEYFRL